MSLSFAISLIIVLALYEPIFISGINDNCPCLSLDNLSEGNANELFEFDPTLNITEYGVGCGTHDAYGDTCLLKRHNGTWCDSEWCFVDPRNCELTHKPSVAISSSSRYYSYSACGYIDEYTRDQNTLNGHVLQGVLHENYRGYQGTICSGNNGDGDNECYGTVVDLADFLVNSDLNITINYTTIPDWVTERARSHQPFIDNKENIKHGACVMAASMGIVDLCIGAFTKNLQRAGVSTFIEMGVTAEYLIVKELDDQQSVGDMMKAIFSPFTVQLWSVTFCVLIVLSSLLVFQEIGWSKMRRAPAACVARVCYNGVFSFWSGAADAGASSDPLSVGGRLTLLAIAVQILLGGAAYTANLTNFLVRSGTTRSIESIEDAIGQQLTICVLRNKMSVLENTYGVDTIKFAINPDDGLYGFPSREQLLSAMDDDICQCTVAGLEEMAVYHGKAEHCDKGTVGKPVIELNFGIPVSDKYALPLNTAISELMQNGKWRQISDARKPESLCSEKMEIDSETTPLTPTHLLGAYVLSSAFAILGLLASLITLSAKKKRKTNDHEFYAKTVERHAQPQLLNRNSDYTYHHSDSDKIPAPPSENEEPDGIVHQIAITNYEEEFRGAIASLTKEIVSLKEVVTNNSK